MKVESKSSKDKDKMKKKRILIAMSGGIDSSVTAMLLKEQGYEIVGVTFVSWLAPDKNIENADDVVNAKILAEKLNIPHYVLDLREDFKTTVIKNFIDNYLSGITPNPCVFCNPIIKWGRLLEKADELNCELLATGHYAQIREEDERFILSKGVDENKDQSYFLWKLNQEQLKRTIFPLGKYKKEEIREMAKKFGFEYLAQQKESQEICFIADDDYRSFLKNNVKDLDKTVGSGNFISTDGKILGKHKGHPFYTIGQRKGLEIAVGHPLYVVDINAEKNTITLGTKEDLLKRELFINEINLIKYKTLPEDVVLNTKIRYRSKAILSKLTKTNNRVKITFSNDVSAITPGQSAVFYENEDLVGGGIIVKN